MNETASRFGLGSSLRWLALALGLLSAGSGAGAARRAVPREHPRLLGSRKRLRGLAVRRREAYRREGGTPTIEADGANSETANDDYPPE